MNSTKFQACKRCVMNSDIDKDISFNEDGICNHCQRYKLLVSSRVFKDDEAKVALSNLVSMIQKAGDGKEYDCIIGVSGGVDSTYVAYLVKSLGLRPLAIHFDNGWNSELAVKNIEKVLNKLDIDLYTYVVDWEEFRDLQLSFLKASVPDGEIPTDHAITALLWQVAVKHKIKYILSGNNFTTEAMNIPGWAYGHSDWRYIKGVHKKYGAVKLKSYPHYNFFYLFYVTFIKQIRTVSILNYIDYNKEKVMSLLENELDWIYYGGKHYESIYTRFFQGYILPKKFNIDKRYGHLSDLINAGQITKEDALLELDNPPCPEKMQLSDKEYVSKKLGLTPNEFDKIMQGNVKTFRDYKNAYDLVQFLRGLVNKLRKYGLYPR